MRRTCSFALALIIGFGAPQVASADEEQPSPSGVTARPGVNEATVKWTDAPNATSYTATANPGGRTCTAASTACTVTGLSNGQAYTFTVVASGPAGTSAASAPSNSVTPQNDTKDPVLVSAAVTPNRISSLGGTVRVDLHITDDISGLRTPSGALDANPAILLKDASGKSFGFTRSGARISGDKYDGIYRYTVSAPSGIAAGPATLTVYPIDDNAGNSTFFDNRTGLLVVGNPAAPTSPRAEATAERNVTVAWEAPTDDGGNVITGYSITERGTGRSFEATADERSFTVPHENPPASTSFVYEIAARNAAGPSAAVVTDPISIAAVAPGAPLNVTAAPGDSQLVVAWDAPAKDGGAPVSGYVATASPSGKTCESSTTAGCTITGLENGQAHTVNVTATNEAGTSAFSGDSSPATPATVPSQVAAPTAAAGPGKATVSWTSTSANGSAVTGYTVTSSPGAKTCNADASATTCTVNGLTNGVSYQFTVRAHSAIGSSVSSASSESVTPVDAPAAPARAAVIPGDKLLNVTWTAPSANGSPITEYTVTTDAGQTCTTGAETRTCVITGLTNGRSYTVTVTATNAVGTSSTSAPSTATVPFGKPGSIARPIAKAGKKSATVSWKAPSANGSAITGYVVTVSNGKKYTVSASKRSLVVKGLTKGRKYTFRVAAKNKAGVGANSASSSAVKIK